MAASFNILFNTLLTYHPITQCMSTNEGAVKFAKNKQTPYTTSIGDSNAYLTQKRLLPPK
jgi:hypothetical protein